MLAAGGEIRAPFGVADADGLLPVDDTPERLTVTVLDADGAHGGRAGRRRPPRRGPAPRLLPAAVHRRRARDLHRPDGAGRRGRSRWPSRSTAPRTSRPSRSGAAMPAIVTPTADDAPGVDPICTNDPVCPLHDLTVAEALDEGRPLALLVATPAFCQIAICGPVLDVLLAVADDHPDVTFLHAEVYAHPHEELDDPDAGRRRARPHLRAVPRPRRARRRGGRAPRHDLRRGRGRRGARPPDVMPPVTSRQWEPRPSSAASSPALHVQTELDPARSERRCSRRSSAPSCAPRSSRSTQLIAERQPLPPLDADALERLRRLTARVAAAQRIVDGTVDRAAVEVGERLPPAAPAWPSTRAPSAIGPRRSSPPGAAAVAAARGAGPRRRRPATPIAGRVAPGAGASSRRAAPSLVATRSTTSRPRRAGAGSSASSAAVARSRAWRTQRVHQPPAAGGGRPPIRPSAPGAPAPAREDSLVLLSVQRDRAHEDVRVAERMWSDLAGDEASTTSRRSCAASTRSTRTRSRWRRRRSGCGRCRPCCNRALDEWDEGWRSLGRRAAGVGRSGGDRRPGRSRWRRPVVLVGRRRRASADEVVAAAPAAPVVVRARRRAAS